MIAAAGFRVSLFRRRRGRIEQLFAADLVFADRLLPVGRNQPVCEYLCRREPGARVLLRAQMTSYRFEATRASVPIDMAPNGDA
jgi:hypothetical protein